MTRIVLGAMLAGCLLAGGFFVTLGNPEASSDPRARGAILTVRPDGCHEPEKAAVTGTAEGLVNGKRVSVPLKLVALGGGATYAIFRDWGAEGAWVLKLVARREEAVTSAIVPLGAKGAERGAAKFFTGRLPSDSEIAAMLHQ